MTRPDPYQYVDETARAALESAHCYPVVAQSDALPSVVYHGVGGDTISTLDSGVHDTTTAVRLDVRARTYAEVVRLSEAIVARLRAGGRLRDLGPPIDGLFVEGLGIYQRFRTVVIRR